MRVILPTTSPADIEDDAPTVASDEISYQGRAEVDPERIAAFLADRRSESSSW